MTDGPQARKYNPVFEALSALEDLERLAPSLEQRLSPPEEAAFHAARAVSWSLLASVTGGQSIDLTPREPGDEPPTPPQGPGALTEQAKAAFGD